MNEYVIVTDSTADLPMSLVKKHDLRIVPMMFSVDGVEYPGYVEGEELDYSGFYAKMRGGADVSTSLIDFKICTSVFEDVLKTGKDVLYIGFSSGLSGSYNLAKMISEQLEEKYPDRKVIAVDSLCASLGEGMLVYNAALEKEKGRSIEEVAKWVEDERLHLCHWFTVDDLFHLKKGGRVSATKAMVGTMLGIKPVLHGDDEGKLIPIMNARGRKRSLEALADKMVQTCVHPEEQMVFISHGDCSEDAIALEKIIREKMNVKDVVMNYIGPVIGSHSGPGTVALFFFGNIR